MVIVPAKVKYSLSLKRMSSKVTVVTPFTVETVPALLTEAEDRPVGMVAPLPAMIKLKVDPKSTGTSLISKTTSTVPTTPVSSTRQMRSILWVTPPGTLLTVVVSAPPSFPHKRKSPSPKLPALLMETKEFSLALCELVCRSPCESS